MRRAATLGNPRPPHRRAGAALLWWLALSLAGCGGISDAQLRERVLEATGSTLLVERDGDDLWVHFARPLSKVVVRASADPDEPPPSLSVGKLAQGSRIRLEGLAATGRRFLTVDAQGRPTRIVAERRLDVEGAPNFRDLGGYATADGRRVAWGQVYRSGSLAELSPEGVARIAELGIALVCDFRSDPEVAEAPSRLPPGVETLRLPVIDPEVAPARLRERFEAGELQGLDAAFMQRAYENMLEQRAAEFGRALQRIARAERPTLVHCSAGKDRSGLLSALLLSALGVPDEIVLGDYEISELYDWRKIRRISWYLLLQGIEPIRLRPVIGSDPAVLAGALATLRERHGSVERYLTQEAGLAREDLAALRTRLLR